MSGKDRPGSQGGAGGVVAWLHRFQELLDEAGFGQEGIGAAFFDPADVL
ncbi:hypothetical protein ACFSLT_29135 [Novosphingobium resinovorum]